MPGAQTLQLEVRLVSLTPWASREERDVSTRGSGTLTFEAHVRDVRTAEMLAVFQGHPGRRQGLAGEHCLQRAEQRHQAFQRPGVGTSANASQRHRLVMERSDPERTASSARGRRTNLAGEGARSRSRRRRAAAARRAHHGGHERYRRKHRQDDHRGLSLERSRDDRPCVAPTTLPSSSRGFRARADCSGAAISTHARKSASSTSGFARSPSGATWAGSTTARSRRRRWWSTADLGIELVHPIRAGYPACGRSPNARSPKRSREPSAPTNARDAANAATDAVPGVCDGRGRSACPSSRGGRLAARHAA